tara:strand:+ start:533 stop:2302 length:1770 start_codon:yes stop_codon:yes gene_type:complete
MAADDNKSLLERIDLFGKAKKAQQANLKDLQKEISIAERSLAQEKERLSLMKEAGVDRRTRLKVMAEIDSAQSALNAKIDEEADLQDEINDKVAKKGQLLQTAATVTATLSEAVNMLSAPFEYQNELTNSTSQNLNVGVKEAMAMNKEFAKLASESDGLMVVADIVELQGELTDAIGDSTIATAKMAASATKVSKALKISAADTAMLYKQFALTDGMTGQVVEDTIMLAKNLADASGVNFNNVMKDVASSGKEFQNYFGKSTKDMLKAAVAARKMGFELADMVSMSQNLLDVEGRIEKQMKFNMLTGKNINLDKATSLMLAGKEEEAMAEIQAQVGDTAELGVLERQALDELLGGKLMEMEQAAQKAEMTEIESAKTDKALLDMDTGNQKAIENLDINAQIATEMDRQANRATNIKDMLAAQTAEYANQSGITKGLIAAQQALAVIQTVLAVAGVIQSFSAIPVVGAVLGIAAAAGVAALIATQASAVSNMADGVIPPGALSDGNSGMVVSGPKGSIQLDKEDTIIAGTNLGGDGGEKGGGKQINFDLTPLLNKMDQLINAVQSSKTVSVDGYQLNEAIHLEKLPEGVG